LNNKTGRKSFKLSAFILSFLAVTLREVAGSIYRKSSLMFIDSATPRRMTKKRSLWVKGTGVLTQKSLFASCHFSGRNDGTEEYLPEIK